LHAPYADLCARTQESIRAGKAGEAAATLSDAVKNGVQNAEVLSLLGLAHRLLGHTSMAASALRAALELMPHNPDIRSNLALMVAASGAPAEARRLWQEVLACRPDHAEARVGIQQLDDPTRHPGEELQLVNAQELGVTKVAATLARCHPILDEIYAHRKSAQTTSVFLHRSFRPQPLYGVQPQSGLGSRVRQAAHDRSVQGPGAGSTRSTPPTAGVQDLGAPT
jgi:tetratricopeptide (TPR) repeat protein